METNLPSTTATIPSVTLNRPGRPVTITFPTTPAGVTTFTVPPGSKWTPSPHWHERYTEKFRVVRGRARFVLNGETSVVRAANRPQTVPKFAVHEFMRADLDDEDGERDDGELVVEEWVDPADGFKEVFFRNLAGIVGDAKAFGRYMPIQMLYTMNYCDNYEVWVPTGLEFASRPITHAVYDVATVVAKLLGLKPVYEQYMPERLHEVAKQQTNHDKGA